MKTGDILTVTIAELAFGGQAVAKLETEQGQFIIFIQDALPQQEVEVRIIKKKKNYAEAKLIKVVKRSPQEVEIPYQRIAGAPFARLPISEQINYKKVSTLEMFRRLSGIEIASLYDEYVASPSVWHYRNKMEYSFSTLIADLETGEESVGFALGFKKKGQWWSVEQLDGDSGLFDAQWEANLYKIRAFCEQSGLPAWNPAKSEGFFRFLSVRKSVCDDEILMNLITTSADLERFDKKGFVELVQSILGKRLAGILHTINDEIGDTGRQDLQKVSVWAGKTKIQESVLGLRFNISMQSFFQTNPLCAELLYKKAIDYVNIALEREKISPVAMDLFCGTGTIAQLLTRSAKVKQVIGVDIIPEAIADAKQNAKENGRTNIDFYAADAGKFLNEYPQYKNKIGVVVLDPPRAGIAPKTLLKVIALNAPAIVYVSCNPSTQARDAATLAEAGYKIQKYSLVDQFPHTSHIESVALFIKG